MRSSVSAEPQWRARASLRTSSLILDIEAAADCQEGLALAGFRALAIADVQRSGGVVAGGERGAHAGIHASAEQDDRTGFGWARQDMLAIADG